MTSPADNKRVAQRWHSKVRLRERYGVIVKMPTLKHWSNLTHVAYLKFAAFGKEELGATLSFPEGITLELLEVQSNRVTRWKLSCNEGEFVVIYDRRRKVIVTVLPKDELEVEDGNQRRVN